MRVLAAILTTLVLCSCATAAGLPSDQQGAESLASKHEAEHANFYEKSLQPFFYENVLNQCVQQSLQDKTPFSVVIAVDASGKSSKTYLSAHTLVSKCLESVIVKANFPKPPAAPFFAHFDISFERRR